MAVTETKLNPRQMIPPFELMSADGNAVNICDFKGRKNMAIFFLPGGDCPVCTEFLHTVVNAYHHYEEENTAVLPIIRDGVERAVALRDELKPPFPILYDEMGKVTAQYTDRVPAVFVVDRYGELYAEWVVGPGGSLPTQKEILDVADLINLECPE
jgi:peroxiredoxin